MHLRVRLIERDVARKGTQQVAQKALSDPSESWPVLASREVV